MFYENPNAILSGFQPERNPSSFFFLLLSLFSLSLTRHSLFFLSFSSPSSPLLSPFPSSGQRHSGGTPATQVRGTQATQARHPGAPRRGTRRATQAHPGAAPGTRLTQPRHQARDAPKRAAQRTTHPGRQAPAQARSGPVQARQPRNLSWAARARAVLFAATPFRRRFSRSHTSTCSRCRCRHVRTFGN